MSTTKQRRRTIRVIERSTLESQLRVDRKRSVICGVKVLGFTSLNGRQYLPEAVKAAAQMYEGILVNVDHPEAGAEDSRSAYDRCGKLVNVRYIEGKGLYADLQLLKGHPITERVLNAAETMPEAYGLSHNAQGEGDEDEQGVFIVRKISGVRHVDLVADPATTKGLAESKNRHVREAGAMDDKMDDTKTEATNPLASHIADVLDQEGLDTAAKVEKILSLVALAAGTEPAEDEMEMDDPAVDDKKAMEGDGEEYPSKDAEEEEEEPLSKDDKKPMESRRYAKLSSQLAQLREQIARTKREADVRRISESASLTLDKQLLADLMQLPADSMVRHVKRLAEAARATKPRTLMPMQESVQTGIPKDVFSWLKD
jgi:hypothetical protein